jgi:hypothetical protein
MPFTPITALPDAPSRLDEPATFVTKADAFVAALAPFVDELNDMGSYLEGLSSGTLDGNLAAIAGLTSAAGTFPYFTGSETAALADITAHGRSLLNDADAAESRTTLGLGTVATLASDTDTTLAANSDTKVATQKAVKAYVDANAGASGDITTSGLTMATGRVLGRDTASTGAIEELTLSEVLDLIGSAAQGDILYRGASSWARLAAGTAGQILRTNGASQNPVWATLSGAGVDSGVFETSPQKPLLADFTFENQGTASAADGSFGIVLTMPSTTVNIRFLRYTAGLPGSSWDLRLRSSALIPYSSNTIHHGAILMRNSANGRIINFAQAGSQIVIQTWSAYNAFNATISAPATTVGTEGFWKRVTCDGTNVLFWTSANGLDWAEIGSTTIAAYIGNIDQVGIGTNLGAASGVTNVDILEHFSLT